MATTPLDPPLVHVRFQPGKGPPFDATATAAMPGLVGSNWANLVAMFPGLTILPLVTLSIAELNLLRAAAQQKQPNFVWPRFEETFRILLPPTNLWTPGSPADPQDPERAPKLAVIMRQNLAIDRVDVRIFPARLAVSDPPSGGGTGTEMGHLDPAPKGIGVLAAWNSSGGGGRGETELLTSVERDWLTTHIEFSDDNATAATATTPAIPATGTTLTPVPGTTPSTDTEAIKHGTATLSIALARLNQHYGVGVAPLVPTALLASCFESNKADGTPIDNFPNAILSALLELLPKPPGSVMMIAMEISAANYADTLGALDGVYGPVEMESLTFAAIQLAVALHVIVVEAAGNGKTGSSTSVSLDGHPKVFDKGDSGAIIVGGSDWFPDEGAPAGSFSGHHRAKVPFNIGPRIDCFAWGSSVYSAWATGLLYNSQFAGTSAATAIIAGAALVVQGLLRTQFKTYLPPLQMRMLLSDPSLGTWAQPAGGGTAATDIIGVMPDLGAIGVAHNVLADLYIRDNEEDDGGIHDGLLYCSPDIIVRNVALTSSADAAFGDGSSVEDVDPGSDAPIFGQKSYVFVRVRNRSGVAVEGAEVNIYWADSGTILQPGEWTPIAPVGSIHVDVPGEVGAVVVVGPIEWIVDVTGHACFIATVSHAQDPLMTPAILNDSDTFHAFVRVNNNVAWRNFDVVVMDEMAKMEAMSADVMGGQGDDEPEGPGDDEPRRKRRARRNRDLESEVRVIAHLPRRAKLEIEVAEEFAHRMSLPPREVTFRTVDARQLVRWAIPPDRTTSLGLVKLKPNERQSVRFYADIPQELRKGTYEIALEQLYKRRALGRVTWRLVEKKSWLTRVWRRVWGTR